MSISCDSSPVQSSQSTKCIFVKICSLFCIKNMSDPHWRVFMCEGNLLGFQLCRHFLVDTQMYIRVPNYVSPQKSMMHPARHKAAASVFHEQILRRIPAERWRTTPSSSLTCRRDPARSTSAMSPMTTVTSWPMPSSTCSVSLCPFVWSCCFPFALIFWVVTQR